MSLQYIITPNYHIADIGEVGSSSIYRAVLDTYQPEVDVPVLVGKDVSNMPNDGRKDKVSRTDTPDKPVIILVRDPVERFEAVCAWMRQTSPNDINGIINKLLNIPDRLPSQAQDRVGVEDFRGGYWFGPVVDYIYPSVDNLLFKYPDHIDEAMSLAGLSTPFNLQWDDGSVSPPQPTLNPNQRQQVEEIYADDVNLYNSINTPGTLYK